MTNPIETLRRDSAEKEDLACRLNLEKALERLRCKISTIFI